MSKTVDERVVSMEFDNSKFESNVKTSMSTLDKLKKSLNFDGVGKGFENIDKAASKVNMNGLVNAADTVRVKFSAMQIAGITALQRITNKAIDTGERLVKSLSVDQISAGWNKYIQKTSSVQTIMNATGKSINEVNGYLKKLMWFSDETSYGFTDMTASLGQLTSSGADIEKVIPMIMGVANATAYAGKGASEFSRAIYNLNQSYGAGHLQLMDWKSLELAGVASKQLKQTLIDTAVSLGKIKEGEVTIATFSQSLQEKWADTQVMEQAFGKFAELTEAAYKAIEEGKYETAAEAIEALSDKYDEVAVKAFRSAQEAKSFTEAVDATKDAVSSSWLRIMETIFGNYEEAKGFWTDLCGILWDIFVPGLEKINNILDGAMTSKWTKIIEKVSDAGVSIEKFENLVKKNAKKYNKELDKIIKEEGSLQKAFDKGLIKKEAVIDSLKDLSEATNDYTKSTSVNANKLKEFQKVVDEVWYGTWDNGHERVVKLTKAGYDYNKVQALVNKTVDGHRLTLADLNEEQLLAVGYTEKEVEALKELAKQAKTTGTDLNILIEGLEKPTGRELFTDAILSFLQGIKNLIDQVATAWNSIFGETTSDQIYSIAENLNNAAHSFEEFTNITSDKGSKIQRVLKGIFAIFDIIDNTVGAALVSSIRTLCKYLGMPINDMLTMSAALGDLAVKANDWIWAWRQNSKFLKAFNTFWSRTFFEMINSVREWIKSLWEANKIQPILSAIEDFLVTFSGGILNYVKGGAKAIGDFVNYLLTLDNFDFSLDSILNVLKAFRDKVIGYFLNIKDVSFEEYMKRAVEAINGFFERLGNLDGFSLSNIWKTIIDFFTNVINKIFNLGKGTEKVNTYFVKAEASISNFATNADNKMSDFWQTMKDFYAWLKPKFAWLDGFGFGEILTIGLGVGTIKLMKSVRLGIDGLTAAFKDIISIRKSITDVFSAMRSGVIGITDAIVKKIKTGTFVKKTESILNLAIAIGVLAASLYLLSTIPSQKLWEAFGAIAALAAVMGGLMLLSGVSGKIGKLGIDAAGAGKGLLALMASLFLIVKAVKTLSKLDIGTALINAGIVAALLVVLTGCAKVLSKTPTLAAGGKLLLEMAGSIMVLSIALKTIASVRSDKIRDAFLVLISMVGMLTLCAQKLSLGGIKGSLGLLELVGSLLLLAYAFKIIANLDQDKVMDNIKTIGLVLGALIGIMSFSGLTKGVTGQSGLGIMGMAASLLLIALAIKTLGKIPTNELWKGVAAVSVLLVVMGIVAALTKFAGQYAAKAGVSLLAMSAAIMMLVIPIAILSQIKPDKLWKAVGAISVLMTLMGVLMAASAFTGNASYKGLIGISIAVGVMAVSLGALAMIKEERLKAATGALSTVMFMLAILEAASAFTATSSLKTIVVIGVILAELVGVFYLMNKMDLDNALENAAALSLVLLSITGATLLLGTLGAAASVGITDGLIAFTETVLILVALFGLLGGLNDLCQGKLKDFVNGGLDILITICEGLGTCIGRFVGAIAGGISDSFEKIGDNLNKFWTKAEPFFMGLSDLDQTAVDGATAMADIIKALISARSRGNAISTLDVETMETELVGFGQAIYNACKDKKGIAGLSDEDKDSVKLISDILEMFTEIKTPEDNLWSKITSSTTSLDTFANQISSCGTSLQKAFSEDTAFGSSLFDADADGNCEITNKVNAISNILNTLAGITIPPSGLFDDTINQFAANLNASAPNIKNAFSEDGFGNSIFDDESITTKASNIAALISAFSSITIPPSGWLDDTISKFADNLNTAAPDIVSAIEELANANISEEQITAATNCATALSALASIDTGKTNSSKLSELINALSGQYSENGTGGILYKLQSQLTVISEIGTNKESIKNASDAIQSLISSCKSVDKVNCQNLYSFQNSLPTLGSNVNSFATSVGGIDSTIVETAMSNCDDILAKCKSMSEADVTGAKNLGDTLKKLAKDVVDGFIKKFTDSDTDVNDAINTLVNNTVSAAKAISQKTKISNAFGDLSTSGVNAIRNKNIDFNAAGSYCVSGFITGIDNNLYLVTAAGTRIGDYAYEAAKKAIDSNSPSKKFMDLGNFSGQGFIIGMDIMRNKVSQSGKNMANAALSSVQDAIYRVSDVIQNDIDSQPTIRPIVDLSEARIGARALSSMFNADTSVNLANQISANRRSRIQTTNEDVVSAIKELGANQNAGNGDTYNINGITYDDGSNVAEAVRTLIRAARVERRS